MSDNIFHKYQYYELSHDIDETRFYDANNMEDELVQVIQNLEPEQYQYEFPSKTYLKQLDEYYTSQDEFFDESSFMTVHDTVQSSVLVDDSRLSPLQLPSQIKINSISNDLSFYPQPVGPSSFLADDSTSTTLTTSTTVLIKLNKSNILKPLTIIQRSNSIGDEGYYDDEQQPEKELESNCIFYPVQNDHLQLAATKIQSVWRGYQCRKSLQNPMERLVMLERSLKNERAMRIAFEKTMENMTILIDQQQKLMFDRLEHEIQLNKVYENKLAAVESKLKNETNSRLKLEQMMSRILDQLHLSENNRIQQQDKLNQLTEQVHQLKSIPAPTTSPVKKATMTPTIKKLNNNTPITTTPTIKKLNSTATTTPTPTIKKLNSTATTTPTPTIKKLNSTTTIKKSSLASKPLHITKKSTPTVNTTTTNTTTIKKPLERPSVIPSNRKPLLKSSILQK